MSEQHDKQRKTQVEQVSEDLNRGLRLCHSLVDDYRSKLASNLNDVEDFHAANDDGKADNDDSRLD